MAFSATPTFIRISGELDFISNSTPAILLFRHIRYRSPSQSVVLYIDTFDYLILVKIIRLVDITILERTGRC